MYTIYMILNTHNYRKYIGRCASYDSIVKDHVYYATGLQQLSRIDKHKGLYLDMKRYGFDKFVFIKLDKQPKDLVDMYKDYYIWYYDAIEKGYNSKYTYKFNIKNFERLEFTSLPDSYDEL